MRPGRLGHRHLGAEGDLSRQIPLLSARDGRQRSGSQKKAVLTSIVDADKLWTTEGEHSPHDLAFVDLLRVALNDGVLHSDDASTPIPGNQLNRGTICISSVRPVEHLDAAATPDLSVLLGDDQARELV